jgi:hypothetical protein
MNLAGSQTAEVEFSTLVRDGKHCERAVMSGYKNNLSDVLSCFDVPMRLCDLIE